MLTSQLFDGSQAYPRNGLDVECSLLLSFMLLGPGLFKLPGPIRAPKFPSQMVLEPARAARAPIPTRFRIFDRAASGWQVGPRGRFCRNLAARPVRERMQKRHPYRYVSSYIPRERPDTPLTSFTVVVDVPEERQEEIINQIKQLGGRVIDALPEDKA
jgi:hypothetical protein